jgi:diguanylate cyclase (GGDEF)-like protein
MGDVLIIADGALGSQAAGQLGDQARLAKPYEGLEALAGGQWSAVLLGTAPDDLPPLARACRRLAGKTPLVALCPPALEPAVRPLVGRLVDDYLIDPPDLADLKRLGGVYTPTAPAPAPERAQPAVPAEDLAALIAATANRHQLEQALRDLLARRLACEGLGWVDPADAGRRPVLLRLEADPPRCLAGGHEDLTADQRAYMAALAPLLGALDQAAARTASLHRLAATDHLTGAYNRRYFYQVTDQVLQRAGRRNLRATVLLYDIDDFKSYNDRFGHAVGDEILRETAALMKQITRGQDIVARIGGDEFAVLFWDVEEPRVPGSRPPESAQILANRFLRALGTHEFPSLGPKAVGLLTISGGLANFPADGRNVRELLRSADLALDAVKRSGKNAIRLIGPH